VVGDRRHHEELGLRRVEAPVKPVCAFHVGLLPAAAPSWGSANLGVPAGMTDSDARQPCRCRRRVAMARGIFATDDLPFGECRTSPAGRDLTGVDRSVSSRLAWSLKVASRSRSRWRVAPVATLAGTLACIPGREPGVAN
jgi:hypothetical protein